MKNLHIQISSKIHNLTQIIEFLQENKINFLQNTQNNIEISSKLKIEIKQKIMTKCNELKIQIYNGKPLKNERNMIMSFIG